MTVNIDTVCSNGVLQLKVVKEDAVNGFYLAWPIEAHLPNVCMEWQEYTSGVMTGLDPSGGTITLTRKWWPNGNGMYILEGKDFYTDTDNTLAIYNKTYGWIPKNSSVDEEYEGLCINLVSEGWAPAVRVEPVFGMYRAINHPIYGWVPYNSNTCNGSLVINQLHESTGHSPAWPLACSVDPEAVQYLFANRSDHDQADNTNRPVWQVGRRYYMSDGNPYTDVKKVAYPSDTNVPKTLRTVIPEALCLGIEAEFSTYNGFLLNKALYSANSKALFKTDSSCGVELVSIPMVPLDMIEFIKGLNVHQLEANANCGVHFHLSRAYLSQSQIGGLVVFMNHPQNLAYITEIAGREPNRYCQFIAGKSDTIPGNKYEMVNLTNTDTIEIRIFAGTNDIKVLQGYVEWLLDLIEWLGTNPVSYLATEFIKYTNN